MQHVQAQNSGLLLSMFGHRLCSVYRLKIQVCCYPCLVTGYAVYTGSKFRSVAIHVWSQAMQCIQAQNSDLLLPMFVWSQAMQYVQAQNSGLLLSMCVWSQAVQYVQSLNSDLCLFTGYAACTGSEFRSVAVHVCLVTGSAVCTGSEFRSIDIHVLSGYRLCSMYRL